MLKYRPVTFNGRCGTGLIVLQVSTIAAAPDHMPAAPVANRTRQAHPRHRRTFPSEVGMNCRSHDQTVALRRRRAFNARRRMCVRGMAIVSPAARIIFLRWRPGCGQPDCAQWRTSKTVPMANVPTTGGRAGCPSSSRREGISSGAAACTHNRQMSA